jgi:hypothetical protein
MNDVNITVEQQVEVVNITAEQCEDIVNITSEQTVNEVNIQVETSGLQGPQGIQGEKGDPGDPAPSIHSGLDLDDGTNPHGTNKDDVGLGNVDNTSDPDKPISTATQTALDVKIPNSFETVSTNLRSYPVIDSTFVSGVSLSKTYSTPDGNIIVTTNFSGGKPTTKLLSGAGLPSGIQTTKTYNFTGRTIPLVSYT